MSGGGGGGYVQQSPGERAQANLAMQQWNDYKTQWLPIEQQYAKQVVRPNYRKSVGLGMAAAGINENVDNSLKRARSTSYGLGINPNSGRGAVMESSGARTSALSAGLSSADQAQKDQYVGRLTDAIGVGRDIQGMALHGYNTAAGLDSAQNIASTQAKNVSDQMIGQATGTAIGTWAGLGGMQSLENWMGSKSTTPSAPSGGAKPENFYHKNPGLGLSFDPTLNPGRGVQVLK